MYNYNKIKKIGLCLGIATALATPPLLHADDTEVLLSGNDAKANILFIMDLSGSMNAAMSGSTRVGVMKEALANVIEQSPESLNIGLMTFGKNTANYVQGVQFPVSPLTAQASDILGTSANIDNITLNPGAGESVQGYLPRIVRNWTAYGGTPIVDALLEASLYFRGEQVYWGNYPSTHVGAAHPESFDPTTRNYRSPIKNQCEANYMVLLSDGSPSYNLLAQNDLARRVSANGCKSTPVGAGQCGSELTQFMAKEDHNIHVDGTQSVSTFSIGLGDMSSNLQNYMRSLVTVKDDPSTPEREGYFIAKNKNSLVEAFDKIFADIATQSPGFSTPSYSLDAASGGMNHDGTIYVPFTEQTSTVAWKGNLKKFKLHNTKSNNGTKADRSIVGKDNLKAFDKFGTILDSAHDLWSRSSKPDGKEILQGGVVSLFPNDPEKRKLYTNIEKGALNSLKNRLHESNQKLDRKLLGKNIGYDERIKLLQYIRGIDTINGITSYKKRMGDILHFSPMTLTYSSGKKVVLVGTNEGFLHAFDANSGVEKFAFMPKELLSNLKTRFDNALITDDVSQVYGLDGYATLNHNDVNKNGQIDANVRGEYAHLYFGLRRGGTGYYALDVTNIENPSFLWSFNADGKEKTLGQSWSKPYLTKVYDKKKELIDVIAITGGYDTIHDNRDQLKTGPIGKKGNDVVFLKAKDGKKIWSLQKNLKKDASQLVHSTPGGARLLDMNRNGVVDRMYFGDTGGYVWRLDMNESLDADTKFFPTPSQLTRFASLSENGSESRQFYNEPDVAILTHNGTTALAISIGSGHRPHPLNEDINDHFYVLLDRKPYSLPEKTSGAPSAPQSGGNDDPDQNNQTVEDNQNRNCMIYKSSYMQHIVVDFTNRNITPQTQVENLVTCDPANVVPKIDVKTDKKYYEWKFSSPIEQAQGQDCLDITIDDHVGGYNGIDPSKEYVKFPSAKGKGEDRIRFGGTTGGRVSKRRVCATYDDPKFDPANTMPIESKANITGRFDNLKKRCTDFPNTDSCTGLMTYQEALKHLLNNTVPWDKTTQKPTLSGAKSTSGNKNNKVTSTISVSQLVKIKADTVNGDVKLNYGGLEGTNIIDANVPGWYMQFPAIGEKVLAAAMTNKGTIYFTTFIPNTGEEKIDSAGCASSGKSGKMYAVKVLDGKPAVDLNDDGTVDEQDVATKIADGNIPDSPKRVYNPLDCNDEECEHTVDIRVGSNSEQAASYDSSDMTRLYWVTPH